jgi:hypothetical protein
LVPSWEAGVAKAKVRTTKQRGKLPDLFEAYLQLFEGKPHDIADIIHPHVQFNVHSQPTLVGRDAVAAHLEGIRARLDGYSGSLVRFVEYVEPVDHIDGQLLLRKLNFTTAKGSDSHDIIGMYHVKDGLIMRVMEMRSQGVFKTRPAVPLAIQRVH